MCGMGPQERETDMITWSGEALALLLEHVADGGQWDEVDGWPVLAVAGRYFRPLEYGGGAPRPSQRDMFQSRADLRAIASITNEVTAFSRHVRAIRRRAIK
jgi:hypothetical protein